MNRASTKKSKASSRTLTRFCLTLATEYVDSVRSPMRGNGWKSASSRRSTAERVLLVLTACTPSSTTVPHHCIASPPGASSSGGHCARARNTAGRLRRGARPRTRSRASCGEPNVPSVISSRFSRAASAERGCDRTTDGVAPSVAPGRTNTVRETALDAESGSRSLAREGKSLCEPLSPMSDDSNPHSRLMIPHRAQTADESPLRATLNSCVSARVLSCRWCEFVLFATIGPTTRTTN